jgi:hypothetical protein
MMVPGTIGCLALLRGLGKGENTARQGSRTQRSRDGREAMKSGGTRGGRRGGTLLGRHRGFWWRLIGSFLREREPALLRKGDCWV